MHDNCTVCEKIKKNLNTILVSLTSCILFFITCFAAYNAYLAYTQGHSINEQIYAVIVILIALSSFIGFVIIMQISQLITLLKKEDK